MKSPVNIPRNGPMGWDLDPNPRQTVSWVNGPLIVHHDVIAIDGPMTRDQAVRRARTIDDIHEGFGWSGGFGYSFGTFGGWLCEGRGAEYRGAHTVGYNSLLPACVVGGNYEKQILLAEDAENLLSLARYLGRTSFTGHRDYNPTACPGKNLYRILDELTRQLEHIEDAKTAGPSYYFEARSWLDGGLGPALIGGWALEGVYGPPGQGTGREGVLWALEHGFGEGKRILDAGGTLTRARFDGALGQRAPYGIIAWPPDKYGMGSPVWGPYATKEQRNSAKARVLDKRPELELRDFNGRQNSIYSRRP